MATTNGPPAKSSKAAGAHKPGKVGGKGQRGEHKQARRNVLDDDDEDGEDDNSAPDDAKPPPAVEAEESRRRSSQAR